MNLQEYATEMEKKAVKPIDRYDVIPISSSSLRIFPHIAEIIIFFYFCQSFRYSRSPPHYSLFWSDICHGVL